MLIISVVPFRGKSHRRLRKFFIRNWGRRMAWTLGIKISVQGQPPSAPYLLVANHLGYIDIVILAAQLGCSFIAKSDVAAWPLVGMIMRSMDMIFVDRRSVRDLPRVNRKIDLAYNRKTGIVFFPEGTSSAGKDVLPFGSSLLDLPARMGYGVNCAAITYHTPANAVPAALSVCWWGDMTFFKHLFALLHIPRVHAGISFAEQSITDTSRKRLASKLREAVCARFIPVTGSEQF